MRYWPGRYRRAYVRPQRSAFRKFLDYALTIAIFGLLLVTAARLDRVEMRLPAATGAVVNDGDSLTLGAERVRRLRQTIELRRAEPAHDGIDSQPRIT